MILRRNWLYRENLKNWGEEPKTILGLIFQSLGTFTGYLGFPLTLLVPKDSRQYIRNGFTYVYSLFNLIAFVVIIVAILYGQRPQNLLEISLTMYLASVIIILAAIIVTYIISFLFEIFERFEIWSEPYKEKIKSSKLYQKVTNLSFFRITWK